MQLFVGIVSTRGSAAFRNARTLSQVSRRFYSSDKRAETIGFIGLGQMGFHMANNLIRKSGAPLVIHDANSGALSKFTALNSDRSVEIAKSPVEVAEKASVIITMLPASPHVKEVYLGPNGVLKGLKKGSLVLDSSTIDASVAQEVAKRVGEAGSVALDTPVSGGVPGAEAGTLTFMCGGSNEQDFERAKKVLVNMGKNIVYCGSSGNGQVAKICNNMLLGISMMGVSETMNLGVKLGMDPKLLASILNTSTGRCWSSEVYNPCPGIVPTAPSSKEYDGGFGISLMAKDMGLAINAANDSKTPVLLGGLAHQVYHQVMKTTGYERKDFSIVYKWLNEKN
ncbi:3-hydroxyisobutyrate dehydrogenase [Basidiobolus meristosporus CBS 931.73]|uniref:3-hydroxyisobutyrate dehydrogenase n=1 Tax=Basidiobolus meristosporus CBS 931.73 TaxID=1314790 RepID=A0A1Y1XF85_9FUNG|nr:3-hydroxyisobutyrate dehydrogenase [Basidiobolus meristosporus CBS 931.73]|eukprot:ORX84405.1 3-hydroxyisobutyrate dehydrogenase [Basidiobolus meristosporus CBS 931.73]